MIKELEFFWGKFQMPVDTKPVAEKEPIQNLYNNHNDDGEEEKEEGNDNGDNYAYCVLNIMPGAFHIFKLNLPCHFHVISTILSLCGYY